MTSDIGFGPSSNTHNDDALGRDVPVTASLPGRQADGACDTVSGRQPVRAVAQARDGCVDGLHLQIEDERDAAE